MLTKVCQYTSCLFGQGAVWSLLCSLKDKTVEGQDSRWTKWAILITLICSYMRAGQRDNVVQQSMEWWCSSITSISSTPATLKASLTSKPRILLYVSLLNFSVKYKQKSSNQQSRSTVVHCCRSQCYTEQCNPHLPLSTLVTKLSRKVPERHSATCVWRSTTWNNCRCTTESCRSTTWKCRSIVHTVFFDQLILRKSLTLLPPGVRF